jgi:hypothetical protein
MRIVAFVRTNCSAYTIGFTCFFFVANDVCRARAISAQKENGPSPRSESAEVEEEPTPETVTEQEESAPDADTEQV